MRTSIPKNNFFPNKLSQEQTLRGASSSENLPLREECIICFSERELQSLSFFVPRVPKRRCKFFIIKAAPLVVTVVVNFPELREQFQMATKSSKPRKTTSSKQTRQPGSTVTPIGPAGNLRETQSRVATQADPRVLDPRNNDQRNLDQKNQDHRYPTDARVEEEVRIRAYELFEQRGRQEGFQDEDWARAEAELLARYRRDKSA
jgi:hypothetical protein